MKKLLLAMAVGAALAWFFDPDNGSRRRDSARRRLEDKGLASPTTTSTTSFNVPDAAPTAVSAIR